MTSEEIYQVKKWLSRGATLSIGRDYAGRQKTKISHGPLNIFTHRYSVTDSELAQIKNLAEVRQNTAA
jgi:hypothetical protein